MFDFSSSLFWYKLIFMAELLLGCYLFTRKLKHKKLFKFRFFGSVLICFGVAFLFPVFFYNAWYGSLIFLSLFSVVVFCLKFCYDESWLNVLFCGLAGYTTQHIAYEVNNLLTMATGFDEGMALGMYGYALPPNFNIFTVLFYFDSYCIVYTVIWFLFARRINKNDNLDVNNALFLFLAAAIVLVDILLNAIVLYHSENNFDRTNLLVSYIYNILCCVFAISIQFGLLTNRKMHRELDTMHSLLRQEQEQYAISKENIDLINRKCHDLKHQIRLIGRNDSVREETIAEIENAISIYDSSVKTDNEALDIILTEKSLICLKNDIRLTCIADGKMLSFMHVTDIYSLFGNAIDNAVEAVKNLENPDQRFIRLKIQTRGRMLSVHLENWFDGKLVFKDGLPVSTKENDGFHGFGLKSMRLIAEKYNGDLMVKTEGTLFIVDILFPLP